VIRTAALTVLALGALATPALALEVHQAPAPKTDAPHFSDTRMFAAMMPGSTNETAHFGQPIQDKPTVIYELHPDGKTADRIDVTDPRDNPFMAQPERSPKPSH
jgi:hypothetical protein